jgi:phosphogluconate dehydratase
LNPDILAPRSAPFQPTGGLRRLTGNLGTAIMKTSAVKEEHLVIEAPARVFHDQESVKTAFKNAELSKDIVIVVRFQGPRANGMPELHGLTPVLGVLQGAGFKVALVTDGRMSGASGKIPAAIHLDPEGARGGPIARIRDGDMVRVDAKAGTLMVNASDFDQREPAQPDLAASAEGLGRELFEPFRQVVGGAEDGASIFFGQAS